MRDYQQDLRTLIKGAVAEAGDSQLEAIPSMLDSVRDTHGKYLLADLFTGGMYSQAALQDAQNRYNTYLYDKYQSPSALAEQYEVAGLNRNFATSGANGSPASASNAQMSNKSVSNVAAALNGFLGALLQGAQLISEVQGIPLDIAAKTWKNILLGEQINIAKGKASSLNAKAIFDEMFYGGAQREGSYVMNGVTWNPSGSPAFQQMLLRNDVLSLTKSLRSYDLNNLKPLEEKRLGEQVRAIAAQAGISEKTLEIFGVSNFVKLLAIFLGAGAKFF